MSFEYLIDPANGPQWRSLLPGKPQPYVLKRGGGGHAMLFTHSHNATHETFPRMQAAQQHTMHFMPDFSRDGATE